MSTRLFSQASAGTEPSLLQCPDPPTGWGSRQAAGLLGWEVLSVATGKEKQRPIGFNSGSLLEWSLFCLCFLISRVTSKGLVFPLHVLLILKYCTMGRMCVCLPVVSPGTLLSGEPKKHFLYSGISFKNLKYLAVACIKNKTKNRQKALS